MGIQWRIGYRLCYEIALQYLISKALILLCLLEFIYEKGKRLQRCVYNVSAWMNSEDGQVCILQFSCLLSTTVCNQNINKQNVNIADETLTDYSFLSRYHYTKSKNYLKRRYWIRHWIPMFFGTPCVCVVLHQYKVSVQNILTADRTITYRVTHKGCDFKDDFRNFNCLFSYDSPYLVNLFLGLHTQ